MPENNVIINQNRPKQNPRSRNKRKAPKATKPQNPTPPQSVPKAKSATQQRKKAVGSPLNPVVPSKIQQAHNIAKNIERKTKAPAYATVLTTPSSTNSTFNVYAFHAMVETLVAHYAMTTDLFSSIQPLDLAYYCGLMTMAHLNSFGCLTSAGNFPTSTQNNEYSVPYAFAKYLEYLSPYSNDGIKASFRWSYANNALIGAPSGLYPATVGVMNTLVPNGRPSYWPQWMFSAQKADNDSPDPHVIFFDTIMLPVEANFGNFLSDQVRITTVSTELNKRGNTISLGRIPKRAPDSSAYSCFLNPVTDPTYNYTGVMSVDSHYDPELTLIFGMEAAPVNYSQLTVKAVPMPTFQFKSTQFPPAFQALSTWVFIAQNFKGPYHPGTVKRSFPYGGMRLKTLFPLRQYYLGTALGELVQSVHTQVLASKGSVTDVTDVHSYNLCLGATVAYCAMQYRRNLIEVCHIQCPAIQISEGVDIYCPQILYTDVTWNTTLPAIISAVLSAIGPVVYAGRLVVPIVDYEGTVTDGGTNQIGPMYWSAFGLQNASGAINAAMAMPWNVTTPSNIQYDGTYDPPINCDATYLTKWYGMSVTEEGRLFTIVPTGGVATGIITQYRSWLQLNVAGQSIPLLQMNSSLIGDPTVMTNAMTVTLDDSTAIVANAVASGEAPAGCSVTGHPSVSVTQPATPQGVALAAISGVGVRVRPATSETDDTSYHANLMRKVLGLSVDEEIGDVQPILGPHTVDLPWSTGKMGVLSTLAQQFASTTSSFANHSASIQRSPDYDIVKTFKEYASPTFIQSFQSVPSKAVPIHQVINQSKGILQDNGGNKVKGAIKWVGKKGIDLAKKGLEPVFKEATKEAKEVFNFL